MTEASALDPAELVGITSEVVSAYMAQNHVPAAEIPALIASVHAAFTGLCEAPERAAEPSKPVPAVSIRRSVTDTHIISLEDGKPYQALKRHLTKLGLTPEQYRTKWGLPKDYPMVASALSNARSAQAKRIGLGAIRDKG